MDAERLRAFTSEITKICGRYGVALVGTCTSERKSGEISIVELNKVPPNIIPPSAEEFNAPIAWIDPEVYGHCAVLGFISVE